MATTEALRKCDRQRWRTIALTVGEHNRRREIVGQTITQPTTAETGAASSRTVEGLVLHKRIIRVFPRRTKATPSDDLTAVARGPYLWDEADAVRVSVAFEWDRQAAEQLAGQWRCVTSDVEVGGPAYGDPGGDFTPGQFLKPGYTITTRGCPNHCWFCDAWKREGQQVRELPIQPGHLVQDNNLLAASRQHIENVFAMLEGQPERAVFSGGLEAARLEPWHVEHLARLRPRMWLAYDRPAEFDPLVSAAAMLSEAGLVTAAHEVGCYVLCGFNRHGHTDTIGAAEDRMRRVARLGLMPFAMLFDRGRDWPEAERAEWITFARGWSAPQIVGTKMREVAGVENNSISDAKHKQERGEG